MKVLAMITLVLKQNKIMKTTDFYKTWFGQIPMVHHSSTKSHGRIYWVHEKVEIIGDFVPMNHVNEDGSIDVLGVETITLYPGMRTGGRDLKRMQADLNEHADKLYKAGAKILKRTKNKLVARYKGETATYEIKRTEKY